MTTSRIYKTKMSPDSGSTEPKPKTLTESDLKQHPSEIEIAPRDPESLPKAFKQLPSGKRIPV